MSTEVKANLETETVALAHPSAPVIVEPDMPVRAVFHLLREQKRGCVLVCRDDLVEGLFTERDALKIMADNGPWDAPISRVMVKQPAVVQEHDSVASAIRKLSFSGYRRLPVVDARGKPVGIIKVSRIVHYFVEHFNMAVYTLPPRPHLLQKEREGA